MWRTTRREFLRIGATAAAGVALKPPLGLAQAPAGPRPPQDPGVEVLHPRGRVPLSFFIDDSTCLVNLAHYAMPQFNDVYPDSLEYQKDWRSWPREIPDSFLREFGEWCAAQGVKGKFSLMPYPACVGWLDRDLPGWSRKELRASLKLVREVMLPHWDLHPEMISHTRVIDLKTGRPVPEISPAAMENSYPQTPKSADELAAYIAYALRILKNCDMPCSGVTSPGGFGTRVKSEFALAVRQAVADVYGAEVPHYFKYASAASPTCRPKLEHVEGLDSDNPRFVVSVPAGTGDWFGNWTGDAEPAGDRYANAEATSGRLVDLIERGEPGIMLCHWPGLYTHGTKQGFEQCKRAILAINARFGEKTLWMKITELARYWAARELTRIERKERQVTLTAPLACPAFTVRLTADREARPQLRHHEAPLPLAEVSAAPALKPGTWLRQGDGVTICFGLPKGRTILSV